MVTLEGVNAKIQRAQDEIERLSEDVAASCESQRSLFCEELRPDVGDKIWIFRGETPIVPIEYSIRLGEIVYNLRSALDQLVWQLVHANYKIPHHRNEFPIYDNETRFNEAVKRKLKGVSQETSSKIKEMQPFLESDEWGALKTLHSLCNIDKHRSVILPHYMLDRCSVRFFERGDPTIKPLVRFRSADERVLKKDMIVYSVQPLDAGCEVNLFVDMKLEGSDSLAPEKYLNMEAEEQQIILVLKDCSSTVQKAVDSLSGEVKKHPLFGRRPPLYGMQAYELNLERSPGLPYDDRDELVRLLLKTRGEL